MARANKKIKLPERLTRMQKIALKHLMEKHGTVAEAMRAAGYSDASVKNPSNLTKSKGYIAILEAAGVTDTHIAKKQSDLLNSAHIDRQTFPASTKERTITHNEKGRKLKKPEVIQEWQHIPDAKIKELIESVSGHVLIYIQRSRTEKVAHFRVPDSVVQSKQIELALKVKGHFAADKLEVFTPEPTDEENEMLDGILNKNKSK